MLHTQPESMDMDSITLSHIGPMIQGYIDRGQVAGVNTLIARRGSIVFQECYGQADMEKGVPMSPETIFRLYSMSKPITSVAALTLYERGCFQLSDPVSAFVPSFKDFRVFKGVTASGVETEPLEREITVRDLFMHTAGFIYPDEESDLGKIYHEILGPLGRTKANRIEDLAILPLAFQPGSHWRYGISNDVLGFLIGVISGMTFGEYLQQEIFEPLGMKDAGFWVPEDKVSRFAACYAPKDPTDPGRTDNLTLVDESQKRNYLAPPPVESGGGGLVCTIGDYARFAQMLVNGGSLEGTRILGRKTIQLMATDQLTDEQRMDYNWDAQRGYGYGLSVRVMVEPAKAGLNGSVGEFGWAGLAGTWVWVDPAEELVGLVMPQLIPDSFHPIPKLFSTIMYAAVS